MPGYRKAFPRTLQISLWLHNGSKNCKFFAPMAIDILGIKCYTLLCWSDSGALMFQQSNAPDAKSSDPTAVLIWV